MFAKLTREAFDRQACHANAGERRCCFFLFEDLASQGSETRVNVIVEFASCSVLYGHFATSGAPLVLRLGDAGIGEVAVTARTSLADSASYTSTRLEQNTSTTGNLTIDNWDPLTGAVVGQLDARGLHETGNLDDLVNVGLTFSATVAP